MGEGNGTLVMLQGGGYREQKTVGCINLEF